MDLILSEQTAEWNKSKSGLKDKILLVVEFPNCISTTTGKSFKWVPTYEQLDEIKKRLDIIEKQWKNGETYVSCGK